MGIRDTEEKLRKLLPVGKRDAAAGWLLFLSGEGQERSSTDELLDVLLHQRIKKDFREKILLDPPEPVDCHGEYFLGMVLYPPDELFCGFGLREVEWTKHVLIAGMTGTGKTNLSFQVLKELCRKQKPFLVFDWKRNYRDLLQLREFKKTKIYTVAREIAPFRFNPLWTSQLDL